MFSSQSVYDTPVLIGVLTHQPMSACHLVLVLRAQVFARDRGPAGFRAERVATEKRGNHGESS